MPSSSAPPALHAEPKPVISGRARAWIVWSPVVIAIPFIVLFAIPNLRPLQEWMIAENHPVEMLTFLSLLPAGLGALWMARSRRVTGGDALLTAFMVILGLGLVWIALEEVAYGQSFFHYESPEFFAVHNSQYEVTLHNLPGLEGHNGFLRLAIGLGGLVGIFAARWPRFRPIGVPPVLMSWFLTITVLAGFDVLSFLHPMGARITLFNELLDEVTEMMIGLAAFLYVWLCWRRARLFEADGAADRPSAVLLS